MLLQIVENTSTPEMFSVLDMLLKGGWIMLPIALLSVVSLYVFVERFLTISRLRKRCQVWMLMVMPMLKRDQFDEVEQTCVTSSLPIAKMIGKGIERISASPKEIEESMESVGRLEISRLENGMPILSIIAAIAPMFGFLGTIVGVIRIFFDISQTSDVSINVVSAGLYVKMVASAAGLIVGILSFVFYHWLQIKLNRVAETLESESISFMDQVYRLKNGQSSTKL